MSSGNGFLNFSPDERFGDLTINDWGNYPGTERFTCPGSGTQEISEIGVYTNGGAYNFHLAIFDHNGSGDCPSTIVANSDTGVLTADAVLAKVSYIYSAPKPQVVAGNIYWLAFTTADTGWSVSSFISGGSSLYVSKAYPTWPSSAEWQVLTRGNWDMSMYVVMGTGGPTTKILVGSMIGIK